jgi:hypothetical protein
MTTLLQRTDNSGRLSARFFRPGRLRLALFRGGGFRGTFHAGFLHTAIGVIQTIKARVRYSNKSCGALIQSIFYLTGD